MAETSWPSPGHNSRAVNADEYWALASAYSQNGLIGVPTDSPLIYGDSSGMHVKVRANRAGLVLGQYYSSGGSDVTKNVTAADGSLIRHDLGVLRYNKSSVLADVEIVAGSPGSGVPTPTIDGTKYEVQVADITIPAGATTIRAQDVKNLGYYIGEDTILCTAATRPPHRFGRRIEESDTGRTYKSDGTNWVLQYYDSGWIAVSPAAGWTIPSGGYGAKIRVTGGYATLVLEVARSGGQVNPSIHSTIATVPAGMRPSSSLPAGVPFVFFNAGAPAGLGRVDSAGAVTLMDFADPIPSSRFIVLQTVSWPVN